MHTHLVATSACCYKRITCMDECGCIGYSGFSHRCFIIKYYDLAVQSMGKLDCVACFNCMANCKFWLVFHGDTDRPCETKFWYGDTVGSS